LQWQISRRMLELPIPIKTMKTQSTTTIQHFDSRRQHRRNRPAGATRSALQTAANAAKTPLNHAQARATSAPTWAELLGER
jgi:hypothetical protein